MQFNDVRRRIFLVGCPRSGTTLLQSLLASHPQITSFPESHFFPHLLPARSWARRFGLISLRAAGKFDGFATMIGCQRRVRPRMPLARVYARAFVGLLDSVARGEGKANWIEKTPENVRYIKEIETFVPESMFIHIVRSGADVVASLYAATNDASFKGFGVPLTLDECITRWTTDLEMTRAQVGKPNHFVVRYESLVSDPSSTLMRVCRFLGLEFDQRMLDTYQITAQRVTLSWEHWKAGARDPIRNANGTKLFESLDAVERRYVLDRTSPIEVPPETVPT